MSMGVALLTAVLALGGGDVVHGRPPVGAFHWVFATNAFVALLGAALSSRVPDADAGPAMRRVGVAPGRGTSSAVPLE